MIVSGEVGKNGEIYIPKEVRDLINLEPRDEVWIEVRGNKLMIKKKVNESGSLEELKEPKEKLPELLFGHGQFYKEYNSVEFTPELTKKLVEIALEYADEDEDGSDNSPAVEVRDPDDPSLPQYVDRDIDKLVKLVLAGYNLGVRIVYKDKLGFIGIYPRDRHIFVLMF